MPKSSLQPSPQSPIMVPGLSRRLSLLRNTSTAEDLGDIGIPKDAKFTPLSPKMSPGKSAAYEPSEVSSHSSSESDGRLKKLLRRTSNALRSGSFSSEGSMGNLANSKDAMADVNTKLDELRISQPLDKRSMPVVLLNPGIELLRITHRKKVKRLFRIDMDTNRLLWNNKSSSYLSIDKIRNIRAGDDAKNYREEFKVSSDYKDLWITIIYNNEQTFNNIKALHVIATRKEDFDVFLTVLKNLLYFKVEMNRSFANTFNNEYLATFHWNNNVLPYHPPVQSDINRVSKTGDRLTYEGVVKLTKKLNINVDTDYLGVIFKQVDADHNGYLNFDEFKYFVKLLRQRPEVMALYDGMIRPGELYLSFEAFKNFIVDVQHEDYDESTIKKLYARFSQTGEMSSDDFTDFMISSYTAALRDIEEDFSRPLNEYFVASSHNTYLLGRQIKGSSSVEGYIRALQRGCRCIEIDIWDGETDAGGKCPVVTHGRTFTTSIDFKQVIEAIRKYSFITSPFPVILSLEVRCTYENQVKAFETMVEVLGDTLVTTPLDETSKMLPSPQALKHKFLVKVKKTNKALSNAEFQSSASASTPSSMSEDNSTLIPSKLIPKKTKTTKISSELSSLGVYVVGTKFTNFSLPESKTFNHCFSFSDRTLEKMIKVDEKLAAVLKHNRKYLLRIYPSQFRFSSSNFNPLPFWEVGVQMVATNWQLFDRGQQINEAMFAVGSHSGYILKPRSLRPGLRLTDNRKQKNIVNLSTYDTVKEYTFTIISAQQLPRPKELKSSVLFDPYVELEVYSGKILTCSVNSTLPGGIVSSASMQVGRSDSSSSSSNGEEPSSHLATDQYPCATFTTPSISRNGFNPVWNQKCSFTLMSNAADLTFVRFLVKCKVSSGPNDILIGVYCCKLEYLKRGYRHLSLVDSQGEEFIFSSLFVKFDETII
ncbi:unnamed protein product [Kuraishia capsulata CBS 1993]|uniref:Phosphoinositide phospholipase C n=1 Tax=Kuraishia capsulata CBS 1993 TaxID=1382522 RepID=W6MRX5_9ASCO|nr:uncharacterized protein KUCA_T00000541001 [Kuraishia capsulata CBS 1993]CDK24575.1 unnamed protein product [Kuraishia capsulata CBS 1993]